MHTSTPDASGVEAVSKSSGQLSPDIQSQTSGVSLHKEKQENNTILGSSDQGPDATGSKDNVPEPTSRVQYIKVEPDDSGNLREVPGKRTGTKKLSSEKSSNFAFVVKELLGKDKQTEFQIVLKGQELRALIHNVVGKHFEHEQHRSWLEQEQTIDVPSSNFLWWYWNELHNAARSNLGIESGQQDLQLLLDHLSEMQPDHVELAKNIASTNKILVKDLWCLFRPGSLVISKPFLDEPQLFRVHDRRYRERDGQVDFIVEAWTFGWTGTELVQEYYKFIVIEDRKTADELTITTDLACYPVHYYIHTDGNYGLEAVEALKTQLTARGRAFRNLCRGTTDRRQHTYNGELLYTPQTSAGTKHNEGRILIGIEDLIRKKRGDEQKKTTTKGDIMIDFTAYVRYTSGGVGALGNLYPFRMAACKCRLCFEEESNCVEWMRAFSSETARNESSEEGSNYLLLPPRVLGYWFNMKAWAQFHVNKVGPMEAPDTEKLMEKLVFPGESQEVKENLKTLIKLHGSTKVPLIVDSIEGKGAGLVVLLHGPPGVGKTLTAETLAKCAGKPLYHVGASDIGLDPKDAEINLGRIFELAEEWDAVLLIDEADVFIDSRGTKGEADLSKNALVSVMLRVLEYFKGILIMTTNRVMTFDVAMLSRCHYAVQFKSLTPQQERLIWQGYIKQLRPDNASHIEDIRSWVNQITKNKGTKLSGREIRNVFTTAQTLAQKENDKKVMRKHLESVYDRLMDFTEAMEKNKTEHQLMLNAR